MGPVGAVEAQAESKLAEASTARTIDVVRIADIGMIPKKSKILKAARCDHSSPSHVRTVK
jgi:hypothetical protein